MIVTPQPLRDSTRVFFRPAWIHEALEDTLPALTNAELLPEQHPASAPTNDLLKGMGVAAGALLTQTVLANGNLGSNRTAAGVVALAGVTVGVAAFFHRQSHRAIPANIQANARARATRAGTNAAIIERNTARLSEARLAISPTAGTGQ